MNKIIFKFIIGLFLIFVTCININTVINAHIENRSLIHKFKIKNKRKYIIKHIKLKGNASWYGSRWNNRKTASGKLFNSRKFTAAHKTLPLGTKVLVKSIDTGKQVIVTINDRGPYVKGRIIDLSKASAYKLGIIKKGVSKVVILPLEVSEIN